MSCFSRSPINGDIVTLIPDQVILFEEPDDDIVQAAGEADFIDVDGRRYFSSAFYASLLAHLGTVLVVSFDTTLSATRRAAFSAAGVECCTLEDLCSGGASQSSLQSLDRFITLVTRSPGLVAVQCCSAFSSSIASTHLAALMLRQRSFSVTAHAVAWMQVAHPGRLTEGVDLVQLERQLSQQVTRKVRRDRSFSVSVCASASYGSYVGAETDSSSGPFSPSVCKSLSQGIPSTPTPTPPSPVQKPTSPGSGGWECPLPAFGRCFSTSSPCLPVPLLTGVDNLKDIDG